MALDSGIHAGMTTTLCLTGLVYNDESSAGGLFILPILTILHGVILFFHLKAFLPLSQKTDYYYLAEP